MAFSLAAAGQMTEKVLYRFGGNSNGAVSSLVRDAAGSLFGTTQVGGSGNSGMVFKVDETGKQTILYSFSGNPIQVGDGAQPMGGLTLDAAGNLYGTTAAGGGPTATVPFSRWIPQATSASWSPSTTSSSGTAARRKGACSWIAPEGKPYGTTSRGGQSSVGSPFGCGTDFVLMP